MTKPYANMIKTSSISCMQKVKADECALVAQCTNETALALADAPRSLRNYVAALQAENERLAEALRNIAAMRWWYGEDLMDAAGAARDALAQEYRND